MKTQLQSLDLKRMQRSAPQAEKEGTARRIFSLWRPIFSHLAGKDFRFHLEKHIEDASAQRLKAYFFVDKDTREDVGLMIFRTHPLSLEGRPIVRLMVNVGLRRELYGGTLLSLLMTFEVLRTKLSSPWTALYFVDEIASPASYILALRNMPGLFPRPHAPVPPHLWTLLEGTLAGRECPALPGFPKEARKFGCVVEDQAAGAVSRPRTPSPWAQGIASWYMEQTKGDPECGLLVIAPLGWREILEGCRRVILRILRPHWSPT